MKTRKEKEEKRGVKKKRERERNDERRHRKREKKKMERSVKFHTQNEQSFDTAIDGTDEQLILLYHGRKVPDQSSIELSLYRDGAMKIGLPSATSARHCRCSMHINFTVLVTTTYVVGTYEGFSPILRLNIKTRN